MDTAAQLFDLPDEMLAHILVFVDIVEILQNSSYISRQFSDIIKSDSFWRVKFIGSMSISFHPLVMSSLSTNKKIQQAFLVSSERKKFDERTWFAGAKGESDEYIWPRAVLPSRGEAVEAWEVGRHCLCSSRDRNGFDEIVENVLVDAEFEPVEDDWRKIIQKQSRHFAIPPDRQRWWSSAPDVKNSPDDTNEILLFTTKKKAIITEVAIKPLKEPALFNFLGEAHRTVFSWPRISIQVFSLPQEDKNTPFMIDPGDILFSEDRRLRQRPIIEGFFKEHTPVYESPLMDAKSNDESWQHFTIPDGVVGNVITFTLWGKHNEQFEQGGYYVCVERVAVRGVPLI